MRQDLRESDQFDSTAGTCVFRGRRAILKQKDVLHELAERCGQEGAMHWLRFFLGGRGARWKKPRLVLFLEDGADPGRFKPSQAYAAALYYELKPFGLATGVFSTDDWSGFRTIVAAPERRGEIAARAVNVLMRAGANVVLTTYPCRSPEDRPAGLELQRRGILWIEYARTLNTTQLTLDSTYESTLAKFGKYTRINLRRYRKRLMARTGVTFNPDAIRTTTMSEVKALNTCALNPVPDRECARRYVACRDMRGGFLMTLRETDGKLLSSLGGWRQGATTVMHHQLNACGHERDSLGTVMRSFFLEHEIAAGAKTLVFYHGTNHTMSHAFDTGHLRDLVVRRRRSFRAWLLLQVAGWVMSPRFYFETHYFGGSTRFLAGNLANTDAEWRSGPSDRSEEITLPKTEAGKRKPGAGS